MSKEKEKCSICGSNEVNIHIFETFDHRNEYHIFCRDCGSETVKWKERIENNLKQGGKG